MLYANAVNSTPTLASTPNPGTIGSDVTASLQDLNSNPLYVHNADYAGIALVSDKLTSLGNFNTWRKSMMMALGARNKVVFIDGTYPEIESLIQIIILASLQ